MDYGVMVASHLETAADVTVACIEVPLGDASQFGIMRIDGDRRIVGFEEKPAAPQPMPSRGDRALASMGIYLFDPAFLYEVLERDSRAGSSHRDFGRNIIPSILADSRVMASHFRDPISGAPSYWRDVGTLDAYWRANLELAAVTPPLDLYDEEWPLRTSLQQLPPAKFVFNDDSRRGMAVDSLVAPGCIVSGGHVAGSVLSSRVRVESGCDIRDSVILPGAVIGENCRIRHAVIDSGCLVPANTVIGESPAEDARRFFVSPAGVVLVCKGMLA
jgi:glucose-1-phosphate adenylyltransferase